MEITLSKEVYYHGESVSANLVVTNNSRKTVKNLKVSDFRVLDLNHEDILT